MSAEIIDLHAWRCAHRAPEMAPVTVPVLLPTWPWGWLQPTLFEVDVGMTTDSPTPAHTVPDQANLGRRSRQSTGDGRIATCENHMTATARRLFLVSSSQEDDDR